MNVIVERLTDISLTQKLLEKAYSISKSTMDYKLLYKRGHSIQRSCMFYLTLEDVPSFVSVHLVRHSGVGQYHLVSSNREDWNPDVTPESVNRLTPVVHQMILNSEHLISMAAKRLCGASHIQTVGTMERIKSAVATVDSALADRMVPKCFPTGYCDEAKCCGKRAGAKHWQQWRAAQ